MLCTLCDTEVADDALFTHVQDVHVGPSEDMKIACAGCPFQVVRERMDLMASHCLLVGHDPMAVRSDWLKEERRTMSIFQILYQMMSVRRESPKLNGYRKRKHPCTETSPSTSNGEKAVVGEVDFSNLPVVKIDEDSNSGLTPEQLIMQAIPVTVTEPSRDPATLIRCELCSQEIVAFHRNTRKMDGKPSLKMRFLTNHILTHHLKDIRPFFCSGCGYSSARPDKLKIHTLKCQVKEKAEVSGGLDEETSAKIRVVMEEAFPDIDFSARKISV